MRDRRLQGIEAIVERQQRVPPEGDDDCLILDRKDRGFGSLGPAGRSATEPRFENSGTMILGQKIAGLVTVKGVRVSLEDGTWGLVRASSNKPSLVVVCESPVSEAQMRAMFADVDARLSKHSEVGEYDQKI
jgi:hypothetical protein